MPAGRRIYRIGMELVAETLEILKNDGVGM